MSLSCKTEVQSTLRAMLNPGYVRISNMYELLTNYGVYVCVCESESEREQLFALTQPDRLGLSGHSETHTRTVSSPCCISPLWRWCKVLSFMFSSLHSFLSCVLRLLLFCFLSTSLSRRLTVRTHSWVSFIHPEHLKKRAVSTAVRPESFS